jgi:hypothetical protein
VTISSDGPYILPLYKPDQDNLADILVIPWAVRDGEVGMGWHPWGANRRFWVRVSSSVTIPGHLGTQANSWFLKNTALGFTPWFSDTFDGNTVAMVSPEPFTPLFEVTADEDSSGTITIRSVEQDGTLTGPSISVPALQ